jgi:hypothetical protein
MEYKKAICRMVQSINTERVLKRIYNLVVYLWSNESEMS